MLKSRLITGTVLVALLIAILLAESVFLQLTAFLVCALVLFELFKATGVTNKLPLFVLGFLPMAALFLNNPTLIGLFTFIYIILNKIRF